MAATPGLHRIGRFDPDNVRSQLTDAGYTAFDLGGSNIVDRVSFFAAVRATLPLDPPLLGFDNWDALNDSLWGGLFIHPATKIAIVWSNTHVMMESDPVDFDIVIDILGDMTRTIAEPRFTNGKPKEVAVIVE